MKTTKVKRTQCLNWTAPTHGRLGLAGLLALASACVDEDVDEPSNYDSGFAVMPHVILA